jgi:hypothetical protein
MFAHGGVPPNVFVGDLAEIYAVMGEKQEKKHGGCKIYFILNSAG